MSAVLTRLRAYARVLTDGGTPPDEPDHAFVRTQRIAPLLYWRLGDAPHPCRSAWASEFAANYARIRRTRELWQQTTAALAGGGIPSLTLGSLPFAQDLYGHPAARWAQDIDLLIRPQHKARALEIMREVGWRPHANWGVWLQDGVHLDLHTMPGDEARLPVLAKAYAQSTEQLFAHALPCHEVPSTQVLDAAALLDNRVVHFFKHHCQSLRHGVEIALLMRRDCKALRAMVEQSRSGRVWACVLAVLRAWELDVPHDPTTPEERAFAARPNIARLLELAAEQRADARMFKVSAAMLGPLDRLRLLIQLAWPSRDRLLVIYGMHSASLGQVLALRARRVARACRHLVG